MKLSKLKRYLPKGRHAVIGVPFVWLRMPLGWRASAFTRMAEAEGVLVRPAGPGPHPGVILFHDHGGAFARGWRKGFAATAQDLMGECRGVPPDDWPVSYRTRAK